MTAPVTKPETTNTPTLAQIIKSHFDNAMRDKFCGWLPGRVESYTEATCKATVSICIREPVVQPDGTTALEDFPVINEVPVMFPGSSSKGRCIRWDILPGDNVLVLFGARSADVFLAIGGHGVDPGDTRHHDYNDAVAIPCLMDFAHVNNASPQLNFTSGQIQAGGTAALAMAADLATLKTKIQSWTPVSGDGGAALKTILTTMFATWPNPSTVLKGQ